MDVKSTFLNENISEEVYVEQPPWFENYKLSNHIFKLEKALYGLKQAPRAWYKKLSSFLIKNNLIRKNIDKILFILRKSSKILIVQIYVDDIIFGATNEDLCLEFSKLVQSEFEMSMMEELTFFIRLKIKQSSEDIFISQSKYIKEIL